MFHTHTTITRILLRALCITFFAFIPLSSGFGQATSASADFKRIIFTPDEAAGLKVQTSGNTLILRFDTVKSLSSATVKQRIGASALGVQQGANNREFVINLKKPYRIRQFVSGGGAGFDVMDSVAASALPPATPPAKPATPEALIVEKTPVITQAKPPVTATPAPVKTEAAKSVVQLPTPKPAVAEVKKEVATVKPVPKPPVATPVEEIIEKKIPKKPTEIQPSDIKKTAEKVTEEIAEDPIEKPATLPPVKPVAPSLSSIIAPPIEVDKATTPDVAEQKKEAPTKEVVTPQVIIADSTPRASEDLLVGIEPIKDGSAIIFPWQARTAAAVFKRDRDWWVVFAAASNIDVKQLQSVLPTSITQIQSFPSKNATLLRFSTDGTVQFSASQPQGSYAWKIGVTQTVPPEPNAYTIETNPEAKVPYVDVKAYDVAQQLIMTDPRLGDRVMVIASNESNKAVISNYANPDMAFIPAAQGIVVQLRNDNVTATAGRTGVRFARDGGLSMSTNLPRPASGTSSVSNAPSNSLLPYARWYVAPKDFIKTQTDKTQAFANATPEAKPQAMLDLATLYLGQGMAEEALSLLSNLRDRFPAFYRENQLAVLRSAANFMMFRMAEAASDVTSEELAQIPEAMLWKDAISLFIPSVLTPKPTAPTDGANPATPAVTIIPPTPQFDYLGYNKRFIQYYPPKIRQKLAIVAADNYISIKEYGKAARTLETLNKDGILAPIQKYAEYLLGKIAADTGKINQAIALWKPLAKQEDDRFIRARAEFSLVTLEYTNNKRSLKSTIKHLDALRMAWRGDTLEQNLLSYLGQLYEDDKDYGNALRTWRDYVRYYPNAPESFAITTKMAQLFEKLFSDGLADDMEPLRSLGLFYEFRELTPVGARGDEMIQKLADRLAQMDLLDKAAALLQHQVKFRLQGNTRAKVGAQLAIVQMLNKEPEKALEALEISGFGGASPALASERNRLTAMALSQLKKPEIALEMLSADRSPKGQDLRLEILWDMQDWPNVINVAENVLSSREKLADALSPKETETLLKLALAYSFEQDMTQLKYLREYYSPLLADSPYKSIFEYVTNDTAPIDPEDFSMVAKQISSTEGFMKNFKDSIAKGRLSKAIDGDSENSNATSSVNEGTSLSEKNAPFIPESVDAGIATEIPNDSEAAIDAPPPLDELVAPATNAPISVEDAATATDEPTQSNEQPAENAAPISVEDAAAPSAVNPDAPAAIPQLQPESPAPSQTAPQ